MSTLPARRWLLPLTLLIACTQPRIGELSALDHAYEGRPNEAWAAMTKVPSSAFRTLHEGTFLHSAGAYARSEEVWAKATTDGLHPVELATFSRLRALNQAALKQDAAALSELLSTLKVELPPVAANEAAILLIVERGWAPRPAESHTSNDPKAEPTYGVVGAPPLKAVTLRLDDAAPYEAKGPELDERGSWESATVSRFADVRGQLRTVGGLMSLSKTMQQSRDASDVWWSPPTNILVEQLVTTPGVHVLLLPTPNGLRERRVDLTAGKRLIVVTRS